MTGDLLKIDENVKCKLSARIMVRRRYLLIDGPRYRIGPGPVRPVIAGRDQQTLIAGSHDNEGRDVIVPSCRWLWRHQSRWLPLLSLYKYWPSLGCRQYFHVLWIINNSSWIVLVYHLCCLMWYFREKKIVNMCVKHRQSNCE